MSERQLPSHLERLPAEVRVTIYKHVISTLNTLIKIEMQPKCVIYDNETDEAYEEDCNDRSTKTFPCYVTSNDFFTGPPELADAISLVRVNSNIRREVAPLAYSNIWFSAWSIPLFTSLMDTFTPTVKSLLRYIQVPMPDVHRPGDTKLLRQTLTSLPSLEVVTLSRCFKIENKKKNSHKWSFPTLLALKTVRRACPQLKYSYHLKERSGFLKDQLVDLSSHQDVTSRTYDPYLDITTSADRFYIDAEYNKWFVVTEEYRNAWRKKDDQASD